MTMEAAVTIEIMGISMVMMKDFMTMKAKMLKAVTMMEERGGGRGAPSSFTT